MVLGLAACNSGGGDGGNSGPPPTVLITAPPTVVKGASILLSAAVVDAAPGVTWLVEGGDAYGTITPDGTYTAPSVVPDGSVVVRATSIDDPRGTATATIRVIVGEQLAVQPNQALSPQGARANTLSGGQRSVAVFGSTVYLVWSDDSLGNEDIYLAVSRDRGESFTAPPLRVTDDVGTAAQRAPSVAVDGMGRAVIAWLDGRDDPTPADLVLSFDVYIATVDASGNGPVTIGANQRVTTAGTLEERDPSVAVALSLSGNLYLAWGDGSGGNTDIFVAKGVRNPGDGFTLTQPPITANQNTVSDQTRPTVAVDASENVLLAWQDRQPEVDQDVYWRRGRFLPGGGVAWTTSQEVRVNLAVEGDQVSPSVAWGPDQTAYIAWGQQQPGLLRRRLYFAKSANLDLSFNPNEPDSQNNLEVIDPTIIADQNFPSLVVNAAEVTIAFADNRNCTGDPQTPCPQDPNGTGPTDVYVVRSVDGGATFHPSVLLNDDTTSSPHGRPSVAVDDVGRAYAIWTDDRNGVSQAFTGRAE
jgi:hypothetical protein